MGPPLRRKRARSFYIGVTFVAPQFQHEYSRAFAASRSLWNLCTRCHCTILTFIQGIQRFPLNEGLCSRLCLNFSLIRIVGVGVQLGPLGTLASNWPIVPAPGDYEAGEFDGRMIGRGNRSTWRKPVPLPLYPLEISHDLTGREPGPPRWEASD
jgi:hypothetical protein